MEVFTVAAGLASISALCYLCYQIGHRSRSHKRGNRITLVSPDDAMDTFLKTTTNGLIDDIDIVGYSVHALLDKCQPLIGKSLQAGKRVRVLILASDSFGLREKSSLEREAQGMSLDDLRTRNRTDIQDTVARLWTLAERVHDQGNITRVNLQVRLYNQFPILRGVWARNLCLVAGSYLYDTACPGRTLPHIVIDENSENHLDKYASRTFRNWFDYLWSYRSREPGLEAVVFDLYGTLVEVESGARRNARRQMAQLIGISEEALDRLWLETQYDSNCGRIGSTKARFEQILQIANKPVDDDVATKLGEIEEELLLKHVDVYPSAIETLDTLRERGYRIGLLTNCSPSVLHTLSRTGLPRYFASLSFSFQLGANKPDQRVYKAAAAELGSPPERCVFIGDGENDEFAGAKAVGMKTIMIARSLDATKKDNKADRVITNLRELPDLL